MRIPLPLLDKHGVIVRLGGLVHIPVIPDWLVSGLPLQDVEALRKVEGSAMRVTEIDQFGYIWFGSWFCLRPDDVESLEPQ